MRDGSASPPFTTIPACLLAMNVSRLLGLINLTAKTPHRAKDTHMVRVAGDHTERLCGNSAGRCTSIVWPAIIKF